MLDGFKRSLGESIESASKEMTTQLQISGNLHLVMSRYQK